MNTMYPLLLYFVEDIGLNFDNSEGCETCMCIFGAMCLAFKKVLVPFRKQGPCSLVGIHPRYFFGAK